MSDIRGVPDAVRRIRHGVVVSCQADAGGPLDRPDILAALALAAQSGGAVGIRASGSANIAAIRAKVCLPIIAIDKVHYETSPVYITPTFKEAARIAEAGGDIIAIDGTHRERPSGEDLEVLIPRIREELGLPVMADVSTLEEGIRADRAGADLVATTLAGYTPYSRTCEGPDLTLVEELARACQAPVVAEGRYHTPDDVTRAFRQGAFSVVVGTAITQPAFITKRFVSAARRGLADAEHD